MAKHTKGEPTSLNLWTLGDVFGAADEVPNTLKPTSVAGMRRCLKAGLVDVAADKKTLKLTAKGREALGRAAQ